MSAEPAVYTERLKRLRALMAAAKLDAVTFVPGPNLTYLTGLAIHLSQDRPLVIIVPLDGTPALIVPVLESERFAQLPFAVRQFTYSDEAGFLPSFEQVAGALQLTNARIGAEGLRMRVLEGRLLERFAPGCTVFSADDALMPWRLHKSSGELDAMRHAIALSETALRETIMRIKPGQTERQIAAQLQIALADAGSATNAFDPIVLSGPNSALPHGMPGARTVANGDLLLFDYGGMFNDYPADITRTFAIGAPNSQMSEVYAVVLAANEAGISASKPGVAAMDVDRAARQVIVDAGYGEYFTHRLGHGLGLDIHEPPYIRPGNAQVLEPGMVYTVEPGIYLPGIGGVRIEDNVAVTETGVEVLTSFPKQLQVIGWN